MDKNRKIVLILFLGALLITVGVVLLKKVPYPPTYEYGEIANNLLKGKGFSFNYYGIIETSPTSFMPPVYPYFLFLNLLVFKEGGLLAVQLFQCILTALISVIIFIILQDLFSPFCGIIGGAISLIYPPLIGSNRQIGTGTFETFFLMVGLLCFYKIFKKKESNLKYKLLLSLSLGLGGLTRPVILVLVPLSFIWIFISKKRELLKHFFIYGFIGAGMIILPWTIRNYIVHKKFIPISSNSGYNLWIGNNPFSTGEIIDLTKYGSPQLLAKLKKLSESEIDRVLHREAISFITHNFTKVIKIWSKKLWYYLWFRPHVGAETKNIGKLEILGYKMFYGIIFILAILGMIHLRKRWREFFLMWGILVVNLMICVVYFVATRYRMIIEPIYILFASYFLTILWNKLVKRKKRVIQT